ncbi:ABC transporter ATP-binding protein [Paenibacillus sp. YYML68]|uniref:ABC transporter ATP-binding protein n=1 Tax=Paenibacillus sp. YYML68 TaxID=2909250 RepID=UPI002490E9CC|nr:ABC transporter ATP-binding protein [Paenibacillus sp. YYML68]
MSGSKRKPVFRRLIRYTKPYTFWVALTVIASLVIAAIDIILAEYIKRLVDGQIQSASEIIKIIAVLLVVGIPCRYIIKYASARFSVKALRDLRNQLVRRIGDMPVSSVESKLSGDLVSRLTNDTAILQNFFIQQFANLFYLPVVFVGALVFLLMTSWKLVLSSIVLLPVGMAIAALLSNSMRSFSEELQKKVGGLNALAQDSIKGLPIMKAFNMQAVFIQKYSLLIQEAVNQSLKLERRYAALGPVGILSLSAPIVFVIIYGGHLISIGELNAGGIVLFLYLLTFIMQPIALVPAMFAQIEEASGAARRLFEALDWPSERQSGNSEPVSSKEIPVQFTNVTFSYNEDAPVLDQVSLELRTGEKVAIVGPSGGGKSTIFKLLCGFYEHQEGQGEIRVFGRSLHEWDLTSLRALLSMVSQESFLFPTTVAENIAYGHPDATREDVMKAAKAAHAHDFIMKLPEGYETVLQERGGGLSGGQKQRIAIARAFLKSAPILLMDEPTSALDTQSEALVQQALDQLMANSSVLVIAHRLSTVLSADRIIVLDHGRIVESGTHEELLQLNGVYKRLYLYQLSLDDETGSVSRLDERSEDNALKASV